MTDDEVRRVVEVVSTAECARALVEQLEAAFPATPWRTLMDADVVAECWPGPRQGGQLLSRDVDRVLREAFAQVGRSWAPPTVLPNYFQEEKGKG